MKISFFSIAPKPLNSQHLVRRTTGQSTLPRLGLTAFGLRISIVLSRKHCRLARAAENAQIEVNKTAVIN